MIWKLHQMDVKTTFLNGVIEEEEVYIEQPPRFETNDKEAYVCRINNSLYGLKNTHSMVWKD